MSTQKETITKQIQTVILNKIEGDMKGCFDELYELLKAQIDRSKKIKKRGRPKNMENSENKFKKRGRKAKV